VDEQKMRAARFGGDGEIELVEVEVPDPGPKEILLRVDSCALCGSDRDGYLNGSRVTPGHEGSGVIETVGEGAEIESGARGVVYLVGFCGACYCCKAGFTNMCLDKQQMYGFSHDGGFADFIKVRADCFLQVADEVALDEATALLDLYGTTNHALRRAGGASSKTVLVLGCGPIGVGAITTARAAGSALVVALDVSPYRLSLAGDLGAVAIDATGERMMQQALRDVPDGFDIVIEAAGSSETQRRAVSMAAPDGTVVFVAHNREPLEIHVSNELIQREKRLLGSEYFPKYEFEDNHAQLLGRVLDPTPVLTHRFGLEDISEAFRTFMSGRSGKVLVRP
jgi:threonine 3-dehydrogenase